MSLFRKIGSNPCISFQFFISAAFTLVASHKSNKNGNKRLASDKFRRKNTFLRTLRSETCDIHKNVSFKSFRHRTVNLLSSSLLPYLFPSGHMGSASYFAKKNMHLVSSWKDLPLSWQMPPSGYLCHREPRWGKIKGCPEKCHLQQKKDFNSPGQCVHSAFEVMETHVRS